MKQNNTLDIEHGNTSESNKAKDVSERNNANDTTETKKKDVPVVTPPPVREIGEPTHSQNVHQGCTTSPMIKQWLSIIKVDVQHYGVFGILGPLFSEGPDSAFVPSHETYTNPQKLPNEYKPRLYVTHVFCIGAVNIINAWVTLSNIIPSNGFGDGVLTAIGIMGLIVCSCAGIGSLGVDADGPRILPVANTAVSGLTGIWAPWVLLCARIFHSENTAGFNESLASTFVSCLVNLTSALLLMKKYKGVRLQGVNNANRAFRDYACILCSCCCSPVAVIVMGWWIVYPFDVIIQGVYCMYYNDWYAAMRAGRIFCTYNKYTKDEIPLVRTMKKEVGDAVAVTI